MTQSKPSLLREFFRYASLNMLGMVGISCYILADTFFVSLALGAEGLAALNLAIPIYSFIHGSGLMIGMGGGKALDTAKAVAENLGLPCIIVPTVASNDAPCSGVAVLYNEQGVVVKAVLMRRNPDLVVVDTEIIAKAPVRLFAPGLGDALATWFEARACKNSGARTMARGNVSNTGLMMARLCYDLLMEKGRDALDAVDRHQVTRSEEHTSELQSPA